MSDWALRERFGYPIAANKVMWDRQGNPKGNPKGNSKKLPSEKAGSSSLARPPSKKSRANKNIDPSSQAGADRQPVPRTGPQSSSLAPVVEEGTSGPKRKSGEGDSESPSEPQTKKGRAHMGRELLRAIELARSDAVSISYEPPGESRDVWFSDEEISLNVAPSNAQQGEREDPSAGGNGTGNPPAPRDKVQQVPSRPSEQIPVYRGQPRRGQSGKNSPIIRSLGDGLSGNPLQAVTRLLPADYTRGEGRLTPELFVDKLIHFQHMVS